MRLALCKLPIVCYFQRDKCDQYWPSLGQSHMYGGVKVTCQRELVFAEFTRRFLEINMVGVV